MRETLRCPKIQKPEVSNRRVCPIPNDLLLMSIRANAGRTPDVGGVPLLRGREKFSPLPSAKPESPACGLNKFVNMGCARARVYHEMHGVNMLVRKRFVECL
jgi:hypothetical protein